MSLAKHGFYFLSVDNLLGDGSDIDENSSPKEIYTHYQSLKGGEQTRFFRKHRGAILKAQQEG